MLLFTESFGMYRSTVGSIGTGTVGAVSLARKWDGASTTVGGTDRNQIVAGRHLTGGINFGLAIFDSAGLKGKRLPAGIDTLIIGFAYKGTHTGSALFYIRDTSGGNDLGTMNILADGSLRWNGVTIVAPAGSMILNGEWHYYEFKIDRDSLANNNATITVRRDGQQLQAPTAVTLLAITDWGQFVLFPNGSVINVAGANHFQDLYLCDATGAVNNDFLGDVRIECLIPSADAVNNGWTTGGTGSGVSGRINEIPADDDNGYVWADDTGDNFVTAHADMATLNGTVLAVVSNIIANKQTSGARSLKARHRDGDTTIETNSSGTLAYDADTPGAWMHKQVVMPATPAGDPWTISKVNSSDYGVAISA